MGGGASAPGIVATLVQRISAHVQGNIVTGGTDVCHVAEE
jgi:hypothetical protein